MRKLFICMLAAIGLLISISLVSAISSYGLSTYQAPPASFQSFYSRSDLEMMWPSLSDPATCKARQDIIIQVAPGGCQPMVVRSDLLAEQNVPVFCQLMGVQVNPFIDIKNLRNIRFKGAYPNEIATVAFHPARAALRTRDVLLGSPLINNIGYAVVVLKKNPKEKELPDKVSVNLTAQIDYTAENAFGIGRAEFLLEPVNDMQWDEEKAKNSFWDGKYSLRLEDADDNTARVSLYHNQKKYTTVSVTKNKPAKDIYLPASYCQAALEVHYDGFESVGTKAIIEISSDQGVDRLNVYKDSKFLDDNCRVTSLTSGGAGFGKIEMVCKSERFTLSTSPKIQEGYIVDAKNVEGNKGEKKGCTVMKVLENGRYEITCNETESGKNVLSKYITNYANITNMTAPGDATKTLSEKIYESAEVEKSFKDAIEAYVKVADDFGAEKLRDTSIEGYNTYGEKALSEAINLAERFEKRRTAYELMTKFVESYPNSVNAIGYKSKMEQSFKVDSSAASRLVEINNRVRIIRLLSIEEPSEKPSADLVIGTTPDKMNEGEFRNLGGGNMTLDKVEKDYIRINSECSDAKSSAANIILRVENSTTICGKIVKLNSINLKKFASIRLVPITKGTEIETNLTVTVGIEKRGIKLSTEKKKEMIENINKSIEKWEGISNKLAKVVKGMKAACLATSAALTFKGFFGSLSGEALARQQVMNGPSGWKKFCQQEIAKEGNELYGKSLSACYAKYSSNIAKDVESTKKSMSETNEVIEGVEKGITTEGKGLFGESSVNTTAAKKKLAQIIRDEYGGKKQVNMPSGRTWTTINANGDRVEGPSSVDVGEMFKDENLDSMTYSQMRDFYMNLKREDSVSEQQKANVDSLLASNANTINENRIMEAVYNQQRAISEKGGLSATVWEVDNRKVLQTTITSKDKLGGALSDSGGELKEFAKVQVPGTSAKDGIAGFNAGVYALALNNPGGGKDYVIQKVYQQNKDGSYTLIADNGDAPAAAARFQSAYSMGIVQKTDASSYNNKISGPNIRFYETEPYKGMPAIVPFDVNHGWYAATRQTLPTFGGLGAYDSSGRLVNFWVCNVGEGGLIEFDEGLGNDICRQVNLQTGQALTFPGLSEANSKTLIDRAVSAIQQAQNQYGSKKVRIGDETFETGMPMANVPSTQCEDFMSPGDCSLLFNVCDPVICPSSRCNFGGKYNVPDVIASGIIGSTLLCLPNFGDPSKGGVIIPVCLTGIQAGIDAYVSVLKNHRDCLQESIDKGTISGICDQIQSFYLCKLFWEQVGPFMNILLPKIVESISGGGGARNGGEYATVASAWQNAENSFKYFTQIYGINSFKAFESKSITEVGATFCKGYVSAAGPKSLKSLIEPDSPPQYYASFDVIKFSDATVPATVQYKVLYHIFAGKNAGVYYSVYLKNPPQSGYYAYNPTVQVDSGYIKQGGYASQTRDFTAPEGYKEVCVNINGDEKCGFKQITTSLAMDYLKNAYTKEQLEMKDISSEEGCISGSISATALIANTNPMSALQESALPAVYNRGIVRICSTQNPGSSTDPTRYEKVGYCGDVKVGCWLDTKSVENAIGPYAVGMQNETLANIRSGLSAALEAEGILNETDAANLINDLKDKVAAINVQSITDVNNLLNMIDISYNKMFYNHHKAAVLYLRAEVFKKIADNILNGAKAKEASAAAGTASVPIATIPQISSFGSKQTVLKKDFLEKCKNSVRSLIEKLPIKVCWKIDGNNVEFQLFDINDDCPDELNSGMLIVETPDNCYKVDIKNAPQNCNNNRLDTGEICDIVNNKVVTISRSSNPSDSIIVYDDANKRIKWYKPAQGTTKSIEYYNREIGDLCNEWAGGSCGTAYYSFESGKCVECTKFIPRITCQFVNWLGSSSPREVQGASRWNGPTFYYELGNPRVNPDMEYISSEIQYRSYDGACISSNKENIKPIWQAWFD